MKVVPNLQQRVTIWHDDSAEPPSFPFELASFNTRHINFRHPDDIASGDYVAGLSYIEHGAHRWLLASSNAGRLPAFDSVADAGAIVWSDDAGDDEREWWASVSPSERVEVLESVADEYTDWSNGYTYGYTVEDVRECGECGHVQPSEGWSDSIAGFIGTDALIDELQSLELREGEFELVDEGVSGVTVFDVVGPSR